MEARLGAKSASSVQTTREIDGIQRKEERATGPERADAFGAGQSPAMRQMQMLQRSVGNREVARMIQTKLSAPAAVQRSTEREAMQEAPTSAAPALKDAVTPSGQGGVAASRIQRLKIYPATADKTDTDWNAAPEEVEFKGLSYAEVTDLVAKREQQLRSGLPEEPPRRGMPERNYVFAAEDYKELKELAQAYEQGGDGFEQTPVVNCSEGQIKVVSKDQTINFGGVSSCMTFTVVLEDGRKVAAHAALQAPLNLSQINDVVAAQGSPVVKVTACGVGSFWGIDMSLFPQDSESSSAEPDTFKASILSVFGGSVAFKDMDADGTVTADAKGEVSV
ncbi:hypothetical protein B5M42_016010 [Paenibacillus athensensis]|uniref:Uncharacterized protein n=1 Tax=Paenibacillus athensensis TaxID=1967502 RepID=A0A4Y8Q8I2_9BACL|nr:hypothetical protein [Paenibacillus athensensis]MCD1260317.1 hypothetical protein [Paenibacillus athensensis]